jgi:putative membrane protein
MQTHVVTDDLARTTAYRAGMFYVHSLGWGWWVLMSIGMVAFWGVVIWGIIALVRGVGSGPRQQASETDRPLDILQRRLARGEISAEEYEQLRDALLGRREKAPA